MSFVRLKYSPPRTAPAHLRDVLRVGSEEFRAGEARTVSAVLAASVVAAALPKSITILDGTPAEAAPALPASVVKSRRALEERAAAFPTDPARALHGLPQLGAEAVKDLTGKNAVRSIRKGAYDQQLAIVGIFCWLAGADAAAEAAAQRAVTLRQDSQG